MEYSASTIALSSLPLEIQHSILSYIPVPSLLSFALTSRHNYVLSTSALSALHLAVFSKRVHGVLAYLNFADTSLGSTTYSFIHEPSLNWLNLPARMPDHENPLRPRSRRSRDREREAGTNISPQAYREQQIHHHNAHLARILTSSWLRSSLTTLTIHTYALLSPSLASALAELPHVRHLTLNFSHPAIHDPCLPAFYWHNAPALDKEGCTAWNLLAGVGEANARSLRLRGLRSLAVRKAALTSRQLKEWVLRNTQMEELSLALVTGVDAEFVEALAKACLSDKQGARAGLRRLEIESCPNLVLKERQDFAWIEVLLEHGLRVFDVKKCENLDVDVLREVCEERGWATKGLVIPVLDEEDEDALETRSLDHEISANADTAKGKGPLIEIDPDFD